MLGVATSLLVIGRMEPSKKQYAAPTIKHLLPEEAKKIILDQSSQGEEDAKELLNLLRKTST